MATNGSFALADADELTALGRDTIDTSAALPLDEPVLPSKPYSTESRSRRGWCFCFLGFVVVAAVVATTLGVVLRPRSSPRTAGGGEPSGQTQQPPSGSDGAPATGEQPKPVATSSAPQSPASQQQPPEQPSKPGQAGVRVPKYGVRILEKTPHDIRAFTQGLEYKDGFFYEGTGLRGSSSLRKVEIATGKVVQKYQYANMSLFGEGITLYKDDRIFALTWRARRGFIFNQTSFKIIDEWKYNGEGWGLTTDRAADEVYMSDGTTALRVLDPKDLSEKRRINVMLEGRPVSNLNELEWICGEVWANVWQTKSIYRIDPTSGVVKSIIEASVLPPKHDTTPTQDVLNGIAFDSETGRIWLTGKLWSKVYQVSITDDSTDFSNCSQ